MNVRAFGSKYSRAPSYSFPEILLEPSMSKESRACQFDPGIRDVAAARD